MSAAFQLNPVTRKRLHRFRHLRRAYASAWLLALITLLTLAADLLCNDRPLVVRFHGQYFYPVLRFYPENAFLPDGKSTRMDYKALARHPVFTRNPSNFIVFAPVPYGPRETIDEQRLGAARRFRITFLPIPRAGNLNVSPDMTVVREQAAGFFLGQDGDSIVGLRLDRIGPLSDALHNALRLRFENQAAPAFREEFHASALPDVPIEITLSTFTPRSAPPREVRLTLRMRASRPPRPTTVVLGRDGNPTGRPPPLWSAMRPEDRSQVRALAARIGGSEPLAPVEIRAGHHSYQAVADTAIAWPHPPVRGHWLGIDAAGRDVLARIVHGLRISLVFSVILVITSMYIGTVIGALQGYYGGIPDILAQRVIEIWSAIPFLYVMILLGSVYGAHFGLLLACYAIFNWIGISYYMRGEFLRLRRQPFVDAARALGVRDLNIIFRHILPNALTPLITFAPVSIVGAIGALAALDYLGFGLPALTPSLGQLLHQAQTHRTAWWLIVYPSLALFVVMLLGVFVGEGIREAYDPRPRSQLE